MLKYCAYRNTVILTATCCIVEASGKSRESSESSECAWGGVVGIKLA